MGIFEDLEARVTKLEASLATEHKTIEAVLGDIQSLDARVDKLESAPTPIPPVEPPTPEPTGFKLGINMHKLATWSQERLFKNGMMNSSAMRLCKASSPKNPFDPEEVVGTLPPVNETGLPTIPMPMSDGNTVRWDLFCDNGQKYPLGIYKLNFQGNGEITILLDTKGPVVNGKETIVTVKKVFTTSGEFEVTETTKLGIQVVLSKGLITSINIEVPGIGQQYLAEFIKPFAIVRHMDLQNINNSEVTDQFVATYDYPHPKNGMPMDLAFGPIPWFCLPHLSTEKYLKDFAAWLKKKNYPKVYIEYSNELWNGQFKQSQWVKSLAPNNGANFADVTKVIAQQAVSRFKILQTELGAYADKVKFVCAGQNANSGVAKSVATEMIALGFKFDVISSAPYFQENSGVFSTIHAAVLLNCKTYLETKTIPGMKTHIDFAKTYSTQFGKKVEYIAYESGQHLVPGKAKPYTQVYMDVQNSPEMKYMIKQLIKACKDNGGDGMIYFNSCQVNKDSGCWGLVEYTGQDLKTSQKYQAILESV